MNNNAYNNNIVKPIPGETVVTQTTVTQQTLAPVAAPVNKGFEIFSTVFAVLAGLGMWLGSVLVLTAMALLLQNSGFYYTHIGGLLVAGFSLWFIASLLNWVPNFAGFGKSTRSGYHIVNVFANFLAACGFALLIAGAACWLSTMTNPRIAGPILWIIGSGLWLASMLIRDMGIRYDAMNTYKNYPVLPTTVNANETNNKSALGAHISSVWGNALATDLYIISAVLLLVGSIFFVARNNNFSVDGYAATIFEQTAGILWIVSAVLVFFASMAHCVARR